MTQVFFHYVLSNLTRIVALRKKNLVKRGGKRASQMSRLFFSCFLMCIYAQLNAQNVYWGLAHGETGPTRSNADIDWIPQTADDWDESIRMVNNKFQDGDGNGLIDTFDLEALYQNFDSTHIYIIKDSVTEENYFWLAWHCIYI